jgi:hypothetical protein
LWENFYNFYRQKCGNLMYLKTLKGGKFEGIFGSVEEIIGENFGGLKGGGR